MHSGDGLSVWVFKMKYSGMTRIFSLSFLYSYIEILFCVWKYFYISSLNKSNPTVKNFLRILITKNCTFSIVIIECNDIYDDEPSSC